MVGVLPYGARLWTVNPFGYLVRGGGGRVDARGWVRLLQEAGTAAGPAAGRWEAASRHAAAACCATVGALPGQPRRLRLALRIAASVPALAPCLASCAPGAPGCTGLFAHCPLLLPPYQDSFDSNEQLVGWDRCMQHLEGLKRSVNPAMKIIISMSVGGWLRPPSYCLVHVLKPPCRAWCGMVRQAPGAHTQRGPAEHAATGCCSLEAAGRTRTGRRTWSGCTRAGTCCYSPRREIQVGCQPAAAAAADLVRTPALAPGLRLARASECQPRAAHDCAGDDALLEPALYSTVVSVGSVNASRSRSDFSNRNHK